MSDSFRMVIPVSVEAKIRYLQRKFPSTEWSGVLFTTHTGSFENKDLVITCVDIFPMDLGNSTYTEFKNTPDITAYIAEHIDELWDCDLNLVHSHHSMATFFSSTDTATLRSEGNDTNNFVSLIVNNEGTYSAAVTRKVSTLREITETGVYKFFGSDSPVPYNSSYREENCSRIEYFMLDIEKEDAPNPFQGIDDRFDEIQRRKSASIAKDNVVIKPSVSSKPINTAPSIPSFNTEQPLPFKEDFEDNDEEKWNALYEEFKAAHAPDNAYVHNAAAKLFLCSLLINPEKIDLDKWVRNNMVKVYVSYFTGKDSFDNYAEWMIDFLINEFVTLNKDTNDDLLLPDYLSSMMAEALYDEVSLYSTADNAYVQSFLDILLRYFYE